MIDFKLLEHKYNTDAAFNKMVNVISQLISEYEIQPSEIREAVFFAQWRFELTNVQHVIRSQDEWEEIEKARVLLRDTFLSVRSKYEK